MAIELKVPSPGESISEVQISKWMKSDGDFVEKDEEIAEIDSDKATLTLVAEADGILKILVKEGETVAVGSVVATIDTNGAAPAKKDKPAVVSAEQNKTAAVVKEDPAKVESTSYAAGVPSISAEKLMKENNIVAEKVKPSGKDGRITKGDVLVVRNAEGMSLAQIESAIGGLAGKARDGKLSIEEMTGGTFTITNGGVFGSMMSTPILNPPQSAILGMHNIVERPMAIQGKVEIRPMMYVALSYDHCCPVKTKVGCSDS
jgi:pyruvate/2-oxoglutarate dehydrogenase complex dihydrolipoamide acyltransferase (E2) component